LYANKDLSSVWHSVSTTNSDRKNLLRLAIEHVILQPPIDIPNRKTRIGILWQGGATSEIMVDRPSKKFGGITNTRAIELVKKFFTDAKRSKIGESRE